MAFTRKAQKRWTWILVVVMILSVSIPSSLLAAKAEVVEPSIRASGGWLESAYAEWAPVSGASGYNAYVKKADSSYVQLDTELIRLYKDDGGTQYYRVDAPGLSAGDYQIKIVSVVNGKEGKAATETGKLSVKAHDRTGFAFVNGTSSGAYNEDGTLKENAKVIYVTEATKNTITCDVVTKNTGTVATGTGLQNILSLIKKGFDDRPFDFRIIGNITDPAVLNSGDIIIDGGGQNNTAGITFEGIGNDATANGWGIQIKNASNVELRNIAFMNTNSSEGDDIGLQGNNHVWVHNCNLFYGQPGSDADQVKGDGALDTKKSTYITHSYNHFFDTGKCNLQGMKSETTENYITYHHNWYDHSDSRHPRIRTCSVHIYNNFYDGNAGYGVGVTLGSSAFVEGNYFRNCKCPMMISMQGTDVISDWTNLTRNPKQGTFSKENGGMIKAYNNAIFGEKSFVTYQENNTEFDAYEVKSANETVPSSVKAYQGGATYNNFDTSSVMYQYNAQSPEEAKVNVEAYAGCINGGDFKWEFDDSVDDTSDDINAALKSALLSYKTKLVSVGGNSTPTTEEPTEKPTQPTTEEPTEKPTQPTSEEPTEKPTEQPTEKPTEGQDIPVVDKYDKSSASYSGAYTSLSLIKDSSYKKKVYVGVNGTSAGAGTIESPVDLETAINSATAGTAIILLEGTYQYDHQINIAYGNNGTQDCYKVLKGADGAKVILDFSSQPYGDTSKNARGLQVEGDYWYISNLTCYGAADNGMFLAGKHNVVERCILQANRDTGLQISRRLSKLSNIEDWPSDNYVFNCTSFDNKDTATGENADGFAAKLTCGEGNVFDGCISYCNCDDGWDLYAKTATGSIGVVIIRNCIAFNNGTLRDGSHTSNGDMNGFKLGGGNGAVPTAHIVFNCLAYDNGKDGFTDNGNGGSLSLTNCTSVNNTKTNFNFYRTKAGGYFRNLLSGKGAQTDKFIGKISNTIYYNSGAYYQVPFSLTGVAVSSGEKLGTVVTDPYSADAFINTNTPAVTDDIDNIMRNADGTATTNGLFMSKDDYSALGAKYNVANQIKVVKAYTDGSDTPHEDPTEPPTEKPTEKPTEEPTEKPTQEPTSEEPTEKPTEKPTEEPTEKPTQPTTEEPTKKPVTTDLTLNVSDLDNGDLSENVYQNGFAILADSTHQVRIENDQTGDFSKRMVLGGIGSTSYRAVAFKTTGKCRVTVHAISGGSDTRNLQIVNSAGKSVSEKTVNGSSVKSYSYTLNKAGTYYIISKKNGINLYSVTVTNGIKITGEADLD